MRVMSGTLRLAIVALSIAAAIGSARAQEGGARWTAEKANQWYEQQPWLVGANYVPSDAINELEMFQPVTFNAALNDEDLGMAESIGMNTMRVFLQDKFWLIDPTEARKRIDEFLTIASKHHIRPI